MEPVLVGKRDAARALAISVRTLENLIAAKQISVRRVGRRVLIPRNELQKFARRDHATKPSGEKLAHPSDSPRGIDRDPGGQWVLRWILVPEVLSPPA